jgi:hypothetical protein
MEGYSDSDIELLHRCAMRVFPPNLEQCALPQASPSTASGADTARGDSPTLRVKYFKTPREKGGASRSVRFGFTSGLVRPYTRRIPAFCVRTLLGRYF